MNFHIQTLTLCFAMLLPGLTLHAQSSHIPNIAGRYDTYGPEECSVVQDNDFVWVTATVPGECTFQFKGTYGAQTYVPKDMDWYASIFAFNGDYAIVYDDGRPTITGTASLLPGMPNEDSRMIYYREVAGDNYEDYSRYMKWIAFNPPSEFPLSDAADVFRPSEDLQLLSEDHDEFNLLPQGELGDLGF